MNTHLERLILFFGERLALVLLAGILGGFLLLNSSKQAFSKQEMTQFVPQEVELYKTVEVNQEIPVKKVTESYSFTVVTVTSSPSPTPAPTASPTTDDIWLKLAECESNQNWNVDSGNGYYGGLQFSQGAWNSVGGVGKPSDSSKDEQILRGKMLQNARGWGPWGGCSKKLGLL